MYNDFRFRAAGKNYGIEDVYNQKKSVSVKEDKASEPVWEKREKADIKPVSAASGPVQKGGRGVSPLNRHVNLLGGLSNIFSRIQEDDLVLILVFLIIFKEHNEDDLILMAILAVLFFF